MPRADRPVSDSLSPLIRVASIGLVSLLFIDRMEQNEELFARYMNDPDFQRIVAEALLRQVYGQIREEGTAARRTRTPAG